MVLLQFKSLDNQDLALNLLFSYSKRNKITADFSLKKKKSRKLNFLAANKILFLCHWIGFEGCVFKSASPGHPSLSSLLFAFYALVYKFPITKELNLNFLKFKFHCYIFHFK